MDRRLAAIVIADVVGYSRLIREDEADILEDKRIRFRIGINVGDIVIDGTDIHCRGLACQI